MKAKELKKEMERLAAIVGAPDDLLPPIVDKTIENELVIIIDDDVIKIVSEERGSEVDFLTTTDLDKALYWIFKDMVLSLSINNTIYSEAIGDKKIRYLHKRSLELFAMVDNPVWLEKRKKEIEAILIKSSFEDGN